MTEQYQIGYGKPPKKGQFKKGQSGNPTGRPKRKKDAPDIRETLIRVFSQKGTVKEDGKAVRASFLDMLLKRVVADGINGKSNAQLMSLNLLKDYDLFNSDKPVLTEEEMMVNVMKRIVEEIDGTSAGLPKMAIAHQGLQED